MEKTQKSCQFAKSYDATLANREYESEIFNADEERPKLARAGETKLGGTERWSPKPQP